MERSQEAARRAVDQYIPMPDAVAAPGGATSEMLATYQIVNEGPANQPVEITTASAVISDHERQARQALAKVHAEGA